VGNDHEHMSYCRFQNTALDLHECENVLEEMFDGSTGPLSEDELRAARKLVNSCIDIARIFADKSGEGDALFNLPYEAQRNTVKYFLTHINESNAAAEEEK
jgi:hypothetical protein